MKAECGWRNIEGSEGEGEKEVRYEIKIDMRRMSREGKKGVLGLVSHINPIVIVIVSKFVNEIE